MSVERRGDWALERGVVDSLAIKLSTAQTVYLTGELHQMLWDAPERLLKWSTMLPALQEVVDAFQHPRTTPNLLDFMRGEGFGQLFVELTGRCNERCVHCYASSSPEVTSQLEMTQLLQVVEEGAQLGFTTIQFTGGDPLLSPFLVQAAQLARQRGYEIIEVYTNGLALRPELAQQLAHAGASFAFSMYSHRPEVHDAITQTANSWVRTKRAIKWAIDTGADVRISAVLREENAADLAPLRKLLQEMGVPPASIKADRERPVGRGQWDEHTSLERAPATEMHQAAPGSARRGKLAVTYDGHIVPCIFDRQVVLGSLSEEQGLLSTLGRKVRSFRRGFPLAAPQRPQLQMLGQPLACGSCRARHSMLDGLELA